jgi:hypothetical protein
MVGSDAVHVDGLFGDATEEVAAADDDADLAAGAGGFGDLGRDCVDEDGVDTEATAGGQGFSGELEEDTLVHSGFKCTGCYVERFCRAGPSKTAARMASNQSSLVMNPRSSFRRLLWPSPRIPNDQCCQDNFDQAEKDIEVPAFLDR